MRRAQASVEILIVVATVFLIIFMLHVFFINPKSAIAADKSDLLSAKEECMKIASAINLVARGGVGFELNLSLPAKLRTFTNYVATIYYNVTGIGWENNSKYCPFSAKRVLLEVSPRRTARFAYLIGKEDELFDELNDSTPPDVFYRDIPASYAGFLANINNYDLVVIEDAHILISNLTVIENYIYGGGFLFISEHIADASTTAFGQSYVKRGKNSGEVATVNFFDEYLRIASGERFEPKDYPYVEGAITKIATYPDGKAAIAKWNFGYGTVYFFSDFDVEHYSAGDFEEDVAAAIDAVLADLSSYVRPPFVLSELKYNVKYIDADVIFRGI